MSKEEKLVENIAASMAMEEIIKEKTNWHNTPNGCIILLRWKNEYTRNAK